MRRTAIRALAELKNLPTKRPLPAEIDNSPAREDAGNTRNGYAVDRERRHRHAVDPAELGQWSPPSISCQRRYAGSGRDGPSKGCRRDPRF
jgi:hypothetical protein